MEERTVANNIRGGKRDGAGRKPVGISTTAMSLKLDNDLFHILKNLDKNKNRYINDAVREKMIKEGLIARQKG